MLLYPPEKEFHLPSLFVQHSDVFRLNVDVVCKEYEGSFKIGSIVHYSAQFSGILFSSSDSPQVQIQVQGFSGTKFQVHTFGF